MLPTVAAERLAVWAAHSPCPWEVIFASGPQIPSFRRFSRVSRNSCPLPGLWLREGCAPHNRGTNARPVQEENNMRNQVLIALTLAALTSTVSAASSVAPQQTLQFSIDWQSPSVGLTDSLTGSPISEGDLLAAPGGAPTLKPLLTPEIHKTAFDLDLISGCIGHLGGTPCDLEIDAISAGTDLRFSPNGIQPGELFFSVDQFARGASVLMPPPTIQTERPAGDSSSDLWTNWSIIVQSSLLPAPPMFPPNHVGAVDGNGQVSASGFTYPGIGLIEPNLPAAGMPNANVNQGDNLDAATVRLHGALDNTYFSLDGGLIDPVTGIAGSDSAGQRGLKPGDVLVTGAPGGVATIWAKAFDLGLDRTGANIPDDLDALAIWENGNGVFDPSNHLYDWLGGNTDMVLFSVRRGSPVIGRPDSRWGIPIGEGDILTTPIPSGSGGLSPFPAIIVSAEHMGLRTPRSPGAFPSDDLNALAFLTDPLMDCDGNGFEDAVEIVTGAALDLNGDGVPDSCGAILDVSPYCFCAPLSPCGNIDPTAGCANSTGAGALLSATGSSVVALDNLQLVATHLPPATFGVFFMGPLAMPPVVLRDGLKCVTGGLSRYRPVVFTGASGTAILGPGIVAYTASTFSTSAIIVAGSTWNYQLWYRNAAGPCSTGSNFTNALSVTFH